MTLGRWQFVFDDWLYSILETPGEENEETPRSVTAIETDLVTSAGFELAPISSETKQTPETTQNSTNNDTIKTSKVNVGAVKDSSMVMDVTVFQVLTNRVEAL